MTNALQVFSYEGSNKVRTIEDNGDIWFVAKDVAKALEYAESSLVKKCKSSISLHLLNNSAPNLRIKAKLKLTPNLCNNLFYRTTRFNYH